MSIYKTLSDAELLAEISEARAARKEVLYGGGVAVVAGEGRRLEYTRANLSDLAAELANLIAEAQLRGLVPADSGGGAINLEFC